MRKPFAPEMTAEAQERLRTFLEAQTDWMCNCPRCGLKIVGSLDEINAHAAMHRAEGQSHAEP